MACYPLFFVDKANRLDVGNAVNPCPTDEDKKLVVVKSPNAVNPLIWDYSVSILTPCEVHYLRFTVSDNIFL